MPVTLGNFSAWITVEGQETECYTPESSDGGKTITCWIASQAGKHFSVNWKDSTRAVSSGARIILAGVKTRGSYIESVYDNPDPEYDDTVTRTYARISDETVRPFMFSNIQLTDDESSCLANDQAQKIGNIEIVINRYSTVKSSPVGGSDFEAAKLLGAGKVNERLKKGAYAHMISYGDEIRQRADNTLDFDVHEELARFVFRYTSYDILRAKGIIPRAPAPLEVKPSLPKPKREELDRGVLAPIPAPLVAGSSNSPPRAPVKVRNVIEILSESEDDVQPLARKRVKEETFSKIVKRERLPPVVPHVIDLTL